MDVIETNPLTQQLKESSSDESSAPSASDQLEEIKQEPVSPSKNEELPLDIKEPGLSVKQDSQEVPAPELSIQKTDQSTLGNSSDSASGEASIVVKQELMSQEQEKPEVTSKTQMTNRLSTISTDIVREVIPVSQDNPSSPWDMDSNPTPELSRTPTPEPCPSYTPVASASAESASVVVDNIKAFESEDPVPPTLIPEGLIKKEEEGQEAELIKAEVENTSS